MKREAYSKILNKLAFLEANKEKIVRSAEELERTEGEIAALKHVSESKPKAEYIRGLMLGYQKALEIMK